MKVEIVKKVSSNGLGVGSKVDYPEAVAKALIEKGIAKEVGAKAPAKRKPATKKK